MKDDSLQAPTVVAGTLVFKDGKVLLGKRKSAIGKGEYGLPGGKLEYLESFSDCVVREVAEETGMKVRNIRFVLLSNVKAHTPLHFVYAGFTADWSGGEPQTKELDKCEGWNWYSFEELPEPLTSACREVIHAYQTGERFKDH